MAVAKKVQQAVHAAIPSKMIPGKAALRTDKRFIILYAPPKTGKTTALKDLRAKWLISDSNTVPTLSVLGALPHPDDTYECDSLRAVRTHTANALKVAEEGGVAALGCEAIILDSLSQILDWHKQDVADGTGQRWLGDNQKNNGWNQFNTEMGLLIDDFVRLSRFVHVIAVCHAAPKPDGEKGRWAGLSLPPQLAEKVGAKSNWLLFMSSRDLSEAEAKEYGDGDPFIQVLEGRKGKKSYVERSIHTIPFGGAWNASVNAVKLAAEEPPNLRMMLVKEGLL